MSALDADESLAAERYRRLYERLVLFFMRYRFFYPEDLADQVVNRLARKIGDGFPIANIEAFALGVARMVAREEQARRFREQHCYLELERNGLTLENTSIEREITEREVEWQERERALTALPATTRSMLQRYHDGRGLARIRARQKLAEEMDISIGTLRKRIFDMQTMLRMRFKARLHGVLAHDDKREKDYL